MKIEPRFALQNPVIPSPIIPIGKIFENCEKALYKSKKMWYLITKENNNYYRY